MEKLTSTPTDLLTVQQAAVQAHCSESTIKRRIRSGQLPAVRHGRKYYVLPDDLDAMFQPVAVSEEERVRCIAQGIAAQAPALSAENKARLASLLS